MNTRPSLPSYVDGKILNKKVWEPANQVSIMGNRINLPFKRKGISVTMMLTWFPNKGSQPDVPQGRGPTLWGCCTCNLAPGS